jgi:hypothetical protein
MQHLPGRAVWDHDGVRDDLRRYLVEHLGDPEAELVIDETGDLKKGASTVGVQRHYTGTAGRVENAQVAVYLVYASDAGHALIDRELYVPRGWVQDPDRCRAAGIPPRSALPPSRPWPGPWSVGPWTPACRPPGSPAMRSPAPTLGCGPSWSAKAFLRLDDGDRRSPGGQAQRWLLVRRNRKTRELAFSTPCSPTPCSWYLRPPTAPGTHCPPG